MDERIEEVLGKYGFRVRQVTRVRGALCLDTDKGIRILKPGDTSKRKVGFEDKITKFLMENEYENVDYIVPNEEGMLITSNSHGENYIVKQWFSGNECRVKEKEDVMIAAGNLAKLHKRMVLPKEQAESEEEDAVMFVEDGLTQILEKHNREMKRVGTYIRSKKQKNGFELCILKSLDEFYKRAEEGLDLLKKSELPELEDKAKEDGYLRHGSYTYHNILLLDKGVATVNFGKASYGLQLLDFYYFMRKVMEKNNWRVPLGDKLIREYTRFNSLDKDALKLLGILLYYPEKYWKIINHYYNNKKSWVAQKDMEKLEIVCEQEWQKILFLQQLFSLSF